MFAIILWKSLSTTEETVIGRNLAGSTAPADFSGWVTTDNKKTWHPHYARKNDPAPTPESYVRVQYTSTNKANKACSDNVNATAANVLEEAVKVHVEKIQEGPDAKTANVLEKVDGEANEADDQGPSAQQPVIQHNYNSTTTTTTNNYFLQVPSSSDEILDNLMIDNDK